MAMAVVCSITWCVDTPNLWPMSTKIRSRQSPLDLIVVPTYRAGIKSRWPCLTSRLSGTLRIGMAPVSRKKIHIYINAPAFLRALKQWGTEFDDELEGADIGDNGLVVISGNTHGNWSATQSDVDDDIDFFAMSMDANGTISWTYQVRREDFEPYYS